MPSQNRSINISLSGINKFKNNKIVKHTQLYTHCHYSFVFIETKIWVPVVYLGSHPQKWERGSEESDTRLLNGRKALCKDAAEEGPVSL